MSNSIAKDFKFFSLLRFAFPTMIMMIFMSLYTIVDGIFISRLIGTDALSAANIVYPVISLVIAVGVMLATGGSAIIAKKLGEGQETEARRDFSFILLVGLLVGIISMAAGNAFIEPIVRILGATDALLDYSIDYLSVLLYLAPACILQLLFQTFFVTAGKPMIGLLLTIGGGIANMVLDYVFMGPMEMGIKGAALATGIGQLIPTVVGILYFTFVRQSLYIVKPRFSGTVLKESCLNGSSEMVTNLSNAVITYLFNIMMLKFLGEPGVAAITIVLYGQFLFNALYMGFSMGVAPVISFNHGGNNEKLLQRIFKICIGFIGGVSIAITVLALIFSPVVVEIFTPKGTETYEIASTGNLLFSINYLFAGLNIFASSMFTAFSDGKTSAIISFVRTFGLIVINILLLPYLIGVNGIWLAVPIAEFMCAFLSVYYFYKKKGDYHYLPV
ncbi:MAG: MATE family efflux transporter [Clostridiales bacterium]|nr:MATE family efflux transporter [Clostridiales bacterium]